MKVTSAHLAFWRARKAPSPSWALNVNDALPSIHRLINSQVESQVVKVEPHNMLVLLRSARRRGALCDMLLTLCESRDNQRRKYARKWLRRIEENQA